MQAQSTEPWLRGTLTELPPVQRACVHALQLAGDDIQRWCGTVSDPEMNARPSDLPPIAFHLRHIARSIDRLLTYAEGRQLDAEQIAALKAEMDGGALAEKVLNDVMQGIERGIERVKAFATESLDEARSVGKLKLPTTVAGLLIHTAEHTQRHVGQAITTARLVMAQRTQSH
jgi:uncharacterized damage-inducible protein DinB